MTVCTVSEPAYVRLRTPDHHYFEDEPITILLYPPSADEFDLRVTAASDEEVLRERLTRNQLELKSGLPIGRYQIRSRWRSGVEQLDREWSDWSKRCPLEVHSAEDADRVQQLRQWEHRLSLIVDHDVYGIPFMTDPLAFPPSYPVGEQTHWFRSPVYEGSPTLLNGSTGFYRDPQAYLLKCMTALVDRGVAFLTWHDLLEGNLGRRETSVILQFDMDGGRHSMNRLLDAMIEMDLRASIMIHRECHDWYEYDVQDLDLEKLKRAQEAGWCIGYHNNALGNSQRLDRLGDYGSQIMMEASKRFRDDVKRLNEMFDIRTYTNHGGNVLNRRLDPPAEADVVCVDRTNTELWQPIRSMFSDGGFAARPGPLHERVELEKPGVHFFRIHPVKYANFSEPWDFPPLVLEDAVARGIEPTPQLKAWITTETQKQEAWLQHREKYRLGKRVSRASPDKPLSRRFAPLSEVQAIDRHYRKRQQFFVREYPAIDGDPRVFWWRMLHAFGPKEGDVLNVGALPPNRRAETTDFLSQAVRVLEMDIDADREPHILGDVTEPPAQQHSKFAGVLLFGLGCIHSPSKAVEACHKLASNVGVGLFGFPDDSHPLRGAMWRPQDRFNWRREREPLHDIGLRRNLWSFERECLSELFDPWQEVTIENFCHYWFVVCRKR